MTKEHAKWATELSIWISELFPSHHQISILSMSQRFDSSDLFQHIPWVLSKFTCILHTQKPMICIPHPLLSLEMLVSWYFRWQNGNESAFYFHSYDEWTTSALFSRDVLRCFLIKFIVYRLNYNKMYFFAQRMCFNLFKNKWFVGICRMHLKRTNSICCFRLQRTQS